MVWELKLEDSTQILCEFGKLCAELIVSVTRNEQSLEAYKIRIYPPNRKYMRLHVVVHGRLNERHTSPRY